MNVFNNPEKFAQGLAAFNRIYAPEFEREYRRGQTPAIFEDEPIETSLVELFERQKGMI